MHDGNIKRTARETGFPISTVRDWKRDWERNGVPAGLEIATTRAIEQFVADAVEVRDLALDHLKSAIPIAAEAGKAKDLATIVGILDDKIVRAQGKPTSINQSQAILPSGEEMRALFAGYAMGALAATHQREQDIIEAEVVVEQAHRTPQLPA